MKNLYNICLGVYTGVNDTEDGEELFICERETFRRLILELGKPRDCKAVSCMKARKVSVKKMSAKKSLVIRDSLVSSPDLLAS